ncbi:unnamed protein product [Didymodactylos carnosus]|uniref:Uncharacterized protein n=1 Tax=Didymodactylos carnosus TaxID=1234261 RepID=A0A814I1S3_9BILA|nr:unnamed protein product [Didymodactylos carnosus]CAF3788974.1 unnamed protein product [Didymodactylos carnosus]
MVTGLLVGLAFLITTIWQTTQNWTEATWIKTLLKLISIILVFVCIPFSAGWFMYQNYWEKFDRSIDITENRKQLDQESALINHNYSEWKRWFIYSFLNIKAYNETRKLNNNWSTEWIIVIITIHFTSTLLYIGFVGLGAFRSINEFINGANVTTPVEYTVNAGFRIASYFIDMLIVLPAFYYVIEIYLDMANKSKMLRTCIIYRYVDVMILLKKWAESVVIDQKKDENELKRQGANMFSTVYILACIIWSASYMLYMLSERKTTDPDRLAKFLILTCSCSVLLGFMIFTNDQIDKMKKTAHLMEIFRPSPYGTIQNLIFQSQYIEKNGHETEIISKKELESIHVHNIVNYMESYATIFGIPPTISTLFHFLLATVISAAIPWILRKYGINVKPTYSAL